MGPLAPRPRILVVDDERSTRLMLRLLLKPQYQIVLANSGEAALRILDTQAARISLVLLDRVFPAGTLQGEETLQLIHERWPGLLVIVLTVDYQVPAAVRCAQLGAFRYVNKMPNLKDTVVPAVAEAMDLIRHQHESDDVERTLRQRRQCEAAMRAGLAVAAVPVAKASPDRVRDFETVRREHWVYAYEAYGGNLLKAARSLNVPYYAYRNKLIEWGTHTPARLCKRGHRVNGSARKSRRLPNVSPDFAPDQST